MRRYEWFINLKNEKAMARFGPQRHTGMIKHRILSEEWKGCSKFEYLSYQF